MDAPSASLPKARGTVNPLRRWLRRRKEARRVAEWVRAGRPAPPPHKIKVDIVREAARTYGAKVLVETGTYLGDMVEATRKDFDQIYSIELSRELFERAQSRFAGYRSIELLQGDSGRELGRLLPRIQGPAVFWLDGHYSAGFTARGEKDCPIIEELSHILAAPNPGHVILIDDARCFGSSDSYPAIAELRKFVNARSDRFNLYVEDDVIRFTPRRALSKAG